MDLIRQIANAIDAFFTSAESFFSSILDLIKNGIDLGIKFIVWLPQIFSSQSNLALSIPSMFVGVAIISIVVYIWKLIVGGNGQ